MNFTCKEISITDETFGCSITFSQNENFENLKLNDLKQNQGQYLMLLKKYKEDDNEDDYLYLETTDPLKSGEIKVFVIHIYPNNFSICYEKGEVEIGINVDEKMLDDIKHIIYKITNKKGQTHFHN